MCSHGLFGRRHDQGQGKGRSPHLHTPLPRSPVERGLVVRVNSGITNSWPNYRKAIGGLYQTLCEISTFDVLDTCLWCSPKICFNSSKGKHRSSGERPSKAHHGHLVPGNVLPRILRYKWLIRKKKPRHVLALWIITSPLSCGSRLWNKETSLWTHSNFVLYQYCW